MVYRACEVLATAGCPMTCVFSVRSLLLVFVRRVGHMLAAAGCPMTNVWWLSSRLPLWFVVCAMCWVQRLEAAKRKLSGAAAADNPDGVEKGADDESDNEADEDVVEARKAAEYFEDGDAGVVSPAGGEGGGGGGVPFQQLNISRPLLRAVEAMGYVTPTPVQQRAVPFALAGRYAGRFFLASLETFGFSLYVSLALEEGWLTILT